MIILINHISHFYRLVAKRYAPCPRNSFWLELRPSWVTFCGLTWRSSRKRLTPEQLTLKTCLATTASSPLIVELTLSWTRVHHPMVQPCHRHHSPHPHLPCYHRHQRPWPLLQQDNRSAAAQPLQQLQPQLTPAEVTACTQAWSPQLIRQPLNTRLMVALK